MRKVFATVLAIFMLAVNVRAETNFVTDDASVVELFTDKKVKFVQGSYENIKITTPEDLDVAEIFLQKC